MRGDEAAFLSDARTGLRGRVTHSKLHPSPPLQKTKARTIQHETVPTQTLLIYLTRFSTGHLIRNRKTTPGCFFLGGGRGCVLHQLQHNSPQFFFFSFTSRPGLLIYPVSSKLSCTVQAQHEKGRQEEPRGRKEAKGADLRRHLKILIFSNTVVVPVWRWYVSGGTKTALQRQLALLRTLPPVVVPMCAKRFYRRYCGQPALPNRNYRGTTTVSQVSATLIDDCPSALKARLRAYCY